MAETLTLRGDQFGLLHPGCHWSMRNAVMSCNRPEMLLDVHCRRAGRPHRMGHQVCTMCCPDRCTSGAAVLNCLMAVCAAWQLSICVQARKQGKSLSDDLTSDCCSIATPLDPQSDIILSASRCGRHPLGLRNCPELPSCVPALCSHRLGDKQKWMRIQH